MRNVGNTCILDHACDNSESQEDISLTGIEIEHAWGVLMAPSLLKGPVSRQRIPDLSQTEPLHDSTISMAKA